LRRQRFLLLFLIFPLITGCQPYAVQLFVRDVPATEVEQVESALADEGLEVVRNNGATPDIRTPTVVYFPGRKSIRAANRSAATLKSLGYEHVNIEPFHVDNHEYSHRTIGIYLKASRTPGEGEALPGVQRASFSAGCQEQDIFLTLVDDGAFYLAAESGVETTSVSAREGQWQIANDKLVLSAEPFRMTMAAGTGTVDDLFSPGRVPHLNIIDSTDPTLVDCQHSLRRLMER